MIPILDTLIKEQENEIEKLQSLIRQRIEEEDYDLAHFHHQVLQKAKYRLARLSSFQGGAFDLEEWDSENNNREVSAPKFYEDQQKIDIQIIRLLKAEIVFIELQLKQANQLRIRLSIADQLMQIKVFAAKKDFDYFLEEAFKSAMIGLGFQMEKEAFIKKYAMQSTLNLVIKEDLSRILFDIYRFGWKEEEQLIICYE